MSDFWKLIKRMGIQYKYLFLLFLRMPFDALRTWMMADLMKAVFFCLEAGTSVSGRGADNRLSGELWKIFLVYGLISTMLFAYNGIIWSKYAAFSSRAEAWLQKEMLKKILSLPLKRVDGCLKGEWLTRLNSDIQAFFRMMNAPINIPHLAVAVVNIILSSVLMFRSSFLLLVVTAFFLFVQLLANNRIVLTVVPKWKEEAQTAMSENTSSIIPLITDGEAILLYDVKELMLKNCDSNSRKLMKVHMKMHMRRALNDAAMYLSGMGGYFVVLLIGYGLIYKGMMTFSDVVYCLQVRVSIIAGVFMFTNCLNNLKENCVCVKRINRILEE